jgi:cell division septation protein DedD
MRKFALIAAGAGILVLAFAVMNVTQGLQTAEAGAGSVTLVAIDTTTAGNNDSTVGTIDSCASISVDQSLTFDLVIQGVDTADRIGGYQVDIDYDPSVISVDSVIDADAAGSVAPNNVTIISRIDSSGGLNFISLSVLTTPGSMTLSAVDSTASPAPPDNHEFGDGVLARVTVTGIAAGTSALDIGGSIGGSDGFVDVIINSGNQGAEIPVATVQDGEIAVGEDCVTATDTPTPTTEPSVTPTPTTEPSVTPTPTTEPSVTPTPTTGPSVTPTPTTGPTATPTTTPTAAPTTGTATPGSLPPTGGDAGSSGPATVWLLAIAAMGLVLTAASWGAIRASRRGLG